MILFLGLFIAELEYGGSNFAFNLDEIKGTKFDHHTITAFSIIIFAYNI